MNKLIHLAIAIYVLLSTGCVSNNTQAHKPMDIDLTKEYPVLDLKLSDIADVSYIPLKGNSNAEFKTHMHGYDNSVYIDSNYMFIADYSPTEYDSETKSTTVLADAAHLYMFDRKGNFIRTIVSPGVKDSEYMGWGMNFTVHPQKEVVTVHSYTGELIKLFDFNGNFLGSHNLGKRYSQHVALGDTLLFVDYNSQYLKYDGSVKDNGRTLLYYDILANTAINGKDLHMNPNSKKPEYLTSSKIVKTATGAYLVSPRTDTIYHINRNLEISPKFVTIWNDTESDQCVIPIAETDDYVLFSSAIDYISEYKGKLPIKTYYLDKRDSQLYEVNCSDSNSKSFEESIFKDELLLGYYSTTQNPNTLAYVLPISYLKENYDLLPADLKHIADIAADNDNPVLMILKFKDI